MTPLDTYRDAVEAWAEPGGGMLASWRLFRSRRALSVPRGLTLEFEEAEYALSAFNGGDTVLVCDGEIVGRIFLSHLITRRRLAWRALVAHVETRGVAA